MLVIIEKSNKLSLSFKELLQYKELLFFFSWRDIKVKYKETTFGIAWVVLQPLILTALFSLIFSKGLRVYSDELPYTIFVLAGLVLWQFVSGSLSDAANSMELNAKIIKKIYFPRIIIPVSAVLTSAFDLIFGLLLLLVACSVFGVKIEWGKLIFALPASLLILTVANLGLACLLSVLNALFKDFKYVIPFLIQLLFFTSSVFYDLQKLGDGWWSEIFAWNPFSGGIQVFRSAFSPEPFPWLELVKPTLSAVVAFVVGVFVFKKLEGDLADLI